MLAERQHHLLVESREAAALLARAHHQAADHGAVLVQRHGHGGGHAVGHGLGTRARRRLVVVHHHELTALGRRGGGAERGSVAQRLEQGARVADLCWGAHARGVVKVGDADGHHLCVEQPPGGVNDRLEHLVQRGPV